MSAPFLDHEDPIHGALSECISAMSALNMHAEPIPDAVGYLSETDAWAKHAMEHLDAVAQLLERARRDKEDMRTKLYHAERALRKLAASAT